MKISRDVNGNKIVKIEAKDLKHYRGSVKRGFSVQTLGNLSYTHKNDLHCIETTKNEIFEYISEHGTARQKAAIGVDQEYTLRDIIRGCTSNSVLFKTSLSDTEITRLVNLIKGRNPERIRNILEFHLKSCNFWGCEERFYKELTSGKWFYCAGQDYISEMLEIRKHLLK